MAEEGNKLKKKGQNIVEFVVVIPLILIVLVAIFEVVLFWNDVQIIQQVALEASVTASHYVVKDSDSTNDGVKNAIKAANARSETLKAGNLNFGDATVKVGSAPYAIYEASGRDGSKLRIDFRDPYRRGIVAQIKYVHRTIFDAMTFQLPYRQESITIIPDKIEISSTKAQQYSNY